MSRGAWAYVLKLVLLVAFVVLALSACGGGGGQPQQQQEAAEQRERNPQPQQQEAKARKFPDYGELAPGKYVADNFEPAFSFRVVGKGWVVREGSEPTLMEISQGVAGPILAFLRAEQVFNPKKVRELDSMPAPEDLVAWLQQHPYLQTDDPHPVDIGGVEGVRLDAVVSSVPPTECGGTCLALFTVRNRAYDWGVFEK